MAVENGVEVHGDAIFLIPFEVAVERIAFDLAPFGRRPGIIVWSRVPGQTRG